MSTFDGIVSEFPYIRIDYFRTNPDKPSPLAYFLSHVHSDHLQGLESLRGIFVYCSLATKELLLRIEKYPHRMNFSRGILESRKQHYRHLAKLLRPIPLQVPTEIEVTPHRRLRVTLFDANHCPGAVMFLIEGNGQAILYTGDIRAEPWWVNSLTRHPVLVPYTLGRKRLDKIYLDTTFAVKADIYRTFPSKAEGLRELLEKVALYPPGTIFYLRTWTFGYEDVWLALSSVLNTKVHVDRYQMGLYKPQPTRTGEGAASSFPEAASLCGYRLGNTQVPGCLSTDESSRLHSCEPGLHCDVIASSPAVYIKPIVTRASDGTEVPELGAGGGHGDLYQNHELEVPDESAVQKLEKLCLDQIEDKEVLSETVDALKKALRSTNKTLSLDRYGLKEEDDISLQKLVGFLSHGMPGDVMEAPSMADAPHEFGRQLPDTISFPYSRHSSYAELCDLVQAFRPRDVHPCTVDEKNWCEEVSMRSLFGHLCSGTDFEHDRYMRDYVVGDKADGSENGGEGEEPARPTRKRKRDEDESGSASTSRTPSCRRYRDTTTDIDSEPGGPSGPRAFGLGGDAPGMGRGPVEGVGPVEYTGPAIDKRADKRREGRAGSVERAVGEDHAESPQTRLSAIRSALQKLPYSQRRFIEDSDSWPPSQSRPHSRSHPSRAPVHAEAPAPASSSQTRTAWVSKVYRELSYAPGSSQKPPANVPEIMINADPDVAMAAEAEADADVDPGLHVDVDMERRARQKGHKDDDDDFEIITLSDAAFDSQQSTYSEDGAGHRGGAHTDAAAIRRRKEAYVAAKRAASEGARLGIISAGDAHTEEEMEL